MDAHRPLPPGVDLEALFAETETREVQRDLTIHFRNLYWQIGERERPCTYRLRVWSSWNCGPTGTRIRASWRRDFKSDVRPAAPLRSLSSLRGGSRQTGTFSMPTTGTSSVPIDTVNGHRKCQGSGHRKCQGPSTVPRRERRLSKGLEDYRVWSLLGRGSSERAGDHRMTAASQPRDSLDTHRPLCSVLTCRRRRAPRQPAPAPLPRLRVDPLRCSQARVGFSMRRVNGCHGLQASLRHSLQRVHIEPRLRRKPNDLVRVVSTIGTPSLRTGATDTGALELRENRSSPFLRSFQTRRARPRTGGSRPSLTNKASAYGTMPWADTFAAGRSRCSDCRVLRWRTWGTVWDAPPQLAPDR